MELSLEVVRRGTLICAGVGLLIGVIKRRSVLRVLRTFFLEPGSASGLALMRITIFWMLWRRGDAEAVLRFARLPEALRQLPHGWGWTSGWLPFDEASVRVIVAAFSVTSALACVGLFTRVAAPAAALLGLYVLGVPNFFTKINHSGHIIELSALVLAVSPCGHALSLDRLWRRHRGQPAPELSPAYTLPLRLCFLLLGTVYLFPGLWKLWEAGDLWIRGVVLSALLHTQWSRVPDFVPPFRPDESQLLMMALGQGTLLLEVGFIFLLFNRWTRILAGFSAVAFHWSVYLLMGIKFHILFPLVVLYDLPGLPNALASAWPGTAERLSSWARAPASRMRQLQTRVLGPIAQAPAALRPNWRPAALVGSILFAGQMVAGFAAIDSWPIAVHPRFERRLTRGPSTVQQMVLTVDRASGAPSMDLTETLGGRDAVRARRLVQKLRGAMRRKDNEARIAAAERNLIEFLEGNGVELEVGDRLSVLRKKWNLFPLGERANQRTQVLQRFELTGPYQLGPQSDRWKKKSK